MRLRYDPNARSGGAQKKGPFINYVNSFTIHCLFDLGMEHFGCLAHPIPDVQIGAKDMTQLPDQAGHKKRKRKGHP